MHYRTTETASLDYCYQELMKIWDKIRMACCKLEEPYIYGIDKPEKIHSAQNGASFSKMKNIFDIALSDTVNLIRIQTARKFLPAQRQPKRRGYMGSVDTALAAKEMQSVEQLHRKRKRRKKHA